MSRISSFLGLVVVLLLTSCGGKDYVKSPVDKYITELSSEKVFSIILDDMDVEGSFFKTYKHRYKIITENEEGVPQENFREWEDVSEDYFDANRNNLGMTVCSKGPEGLNKMAQPPGYRYVGNKRYGEWRTHNGNSFWAFYGQYMFMSHMFGMMHRPVYRSHYNTYRSGYYGSRPYYGPTTGGRAMYGTNSAQTRKSKPNFYKRRAQRGWGSSGRSRSGGRSRGSGFGK